MEPSAPVEAGTQLPPGTFVIDWYEHERFAETLRDDATPEGLAHPAYAYVAAQRGLGAGIGEILTLAGFDTDDGTMLSSCELTFHEPLRIGHPYEVTGEIVSVERRTGRSGPVELLTVRETLSDNDRRPCAAVENVFVVPRRGVAA